MKVNVIALLDGGLLPTSWPKTSVQVQELQALTPPKVRLKPWRKLDKGMAVDALRANLLKLCNVEVWQSCSMQYFDDGVLVDIDSDTDVEGCVETFVEEYEQETPYIYIRQTHSAQVDSSVAIAAISPTIQGVFSTGTIEAAKSLGASLKVSYAVEDAPAAKRTLPSEGGGCATTAKRAATSPRPPVEAPGSNIFEVARQRSAKRASNHSAVVVDPGRAELEQIEAKCMSDG